MRIMSVSTIANNTVSIDVSGNLAQSTWRCTPKQIAGLNNVAAWRPQKEFSTLMKFALFLFEENKKNYQEYLDSKEQEQKAEVVAPTKE